MASFVQYLDQICELRKQKKYDQAWSLSQQALLDLRRQNDESWYMVYYQTSKILASEKKWKEALFHFGLMLKELNRIGGEGQRKYILRLLKHLNLSDKLAEFTAMCVYSKDPVELKLQITKLIENSRQP